MGGFSFASVILSYFLVAGGLLSGSLLFGYLKSTSEAVGYLCIAAGSFVGGFVAARASRGATIVEPAIGAIAVIATIVGMIAGTSVGKYMWGAAQDETARLVAALAGSSAIGALAGAFVSEKLLGEATLSSVPWLVYSAFCTFGASALATFVTLILFVKTTNGEQPEDTLGKMMIVGVGVGCLLAGLAIGASARVRTLIASFLGGGAGVAGFFLLVTRDVHDNKDAAAGIAVMAIGGAIVTLIGTALGWVTVGKRAAT
jgi:hypothetical protein